MDRLHQRDKIFDIVHFTCNSSRSSDKEYNLPKIRHCDNDIRINETTDYEQSRHKCVNS